MAIEKLTARRNNKTQTNPQIKRHKMSHELRLIRPHAGHKNLEHMRLNSYHHKHHLWRKWWIFIGSSKFIRNTNVVISQCGSQQHGSTFNQK
jgi:hypothetical protein